MFKTLKTRISNFTISLYQLYLFNVKKAVNYRIALSIFNDSDSESDDNLLVVHGIGLNKLGGRHQNVEVYNMDNGKRFKARVVGNGQRYKIKAKDGLMLTYNQRKWLGLDSKNSRDVRVNLAVYPILSSEETRSREFLYLRMGLLLALVSFFFSVSN